MSQVSFKCSTCGLNITAPESMSGENIECPKCKRYMNVPKVEAPPTPPPVQPPVALASSIRRAKITAKFDYPADQVFTAGLQGIRSCNCDLVDFDQPNRRIRFTFFVNGRVTEHQAYVFELSRDESEFEIISNDPNASGMFDPFYEALVHATKKQLQTASALARRTEPEETRVQVNVDARQYGYDDDDYPRRRRRSSKSPGGIAVAGFVCGLIGVVFFCIPGMSLILGILGVIFGCVGLNSRQHGLAVAALSLGAIAVILSLIMITAFTAAERRRDWSGGPGVVVCQSAIIHGNG